MTGRIGALIIKELLALLQDKKARMALIVPPVLQLLIFSFAATLDVKDVEIGVWNKDNGKYSYELVQRFAGSPTFRNITFYDNPAAVRSALENQDVIMVLHLDENFSRGILQNKGGNAQLLLDGRRSNSAQIVQGYALGIFEQFQRDTGASLRVLDAGTIILPRNWYNPNLIYTWFTVPGLVGVLTLLIGLLVTALSVAREREVGTFEQLLVSPLLPFEILLGKAIPAIMIGMAEGSLILLAAIFLFGIPFTGSLHYLYFSMFVFVVSIVGIGLFISSLAKTQQQGLIGVMIFMAPAVALSGFATPIENMPEWLQTATYANPLRYFLVVVRGVFLKELPLHVVLQQTYPMAVIAIFTLTGADWFFRRKLE
jgi:ABC-2 type transport system permease protein